MYVDNTTLLEELLASHALGRVTDNCYRLFEAIAVQRINVLFKYDKNTYFEEVKSDCIAKCLHIWQNYSFERDNAFAYFVTVIDNVIKLFFITHNVRVISIDEQEEHYRDSD